MPRSDSSDDSSDDRSAAVTRGARIITKEKGSSKMKIIHVTRPRSKVEALLHSDQHLFLLANPREPQDNWKVIRQLCNYLNVKPILNKDDGDNGWLIMSTLSASEIKSLLHEINEFMLPKWAMKVKARTQEHIRVTDDAFGKLKSQSIVDSSDDSDSHEDPPKSVRVKVE